MIKERGGRGLRQQKYDNMIAIISFHNSSLADFAAAIAFIRNRRHAYLHIGIGIASDSAVLGEYMLDIHL